MFNNPTHMSLPAPSEVHLWHVPLQRSAARFSQLLSQDERARADRRVGDRRDAFIAAHVSTRLILARYLACPPENVPLASPPGERPTVDDRYLSFSLSHTEGSAVVAVGQGTIGVDLEQVEAIPPDEVEGMADFILTSAEQVELRRRQPRERQTELVRAWSRKEAVLKACGVGLSQAVMADISIQRTTDGGHTASMVGDAQLFHVEDIDLGPDYVGAIATGRLSSVVTSLNFEAVAA